VTVSGRTRISIKRLLVVLLAILGVLVAALSFITTRQLDSATKRAQSEKRRFESIRIADSLRKSSDDLTNMVRLYVTTGQPRYRRTTASCWRSAAATRRGRATTTRRSGTACCRAARRA
jgi:CHASE3 domain sensor protein